MKRMIIILILMSLFLVNSSCDKIDVYKDTPFAIKKLIKAYEKQCYCSVDEYEYLNQRVYCFYNCPSVRDGYDIVFDSDGNHMCAVGGIEGDYRGEHCDVFGNMVFVRNIWNKIE